MVFTIHTQFLGAKIGIIKCVIHGLLTKLLAVGKFNLIDVSTNTFPRITLKTPVFKLIFFQWSFQLYLSS